MIGWDGIDGEVSDLFDGEIFAFFRSSFRIRSELIPMTKHLLRRQAVQLCRVCIFT